MSQKIAELEIVIHDQASEAATKVDNLADAAKKLGGTAKGINDVASGMTKLDKATGSTGADKLKNAVSAIEENVKNLSDALDQAQKKISNFGSADIKTNIPEVGKQAEGIKSATKGAADGIKEVSEKSNEAKSSVDRFSAGLSYAGSVLKNMRHILPGVVNQLTRMVKMRILRTIVKNFLAGVTEGLQNVYNWASLVGNSFKSTMDGMASSALYLKNSIGAAFASLVSLVAPHINNLIDVLVEGINYVNMFFAVLGGKSTYTRAKKVAVDYGKAATSAIGGAAGAAKELKETLSVLDFDELNQLADQPTPSTGGGGGGGGGTPGTDYADMFETADVTANALTKAALWIKENFDDILDVVKAIGLGILAWKISNAFLGDVLSLKQMLGITLMVTGFTLEFEGAKAIGRGDATTMDYIKSAIGAALGIGGALLTFGTTPLGWTVGIGLAITTFIVGLSVGRWEKLREELYNTSEAYKTAVDTIEWAAGKIAWANDTITHLESHELMDDEEYKKWATAASMLEKIQGFQGVNVHDADLTALESYMSTLNSILKEAGIDEYARYWIDANDNIQLNVTSIQDIINKMLELSKMKAYMRWIDENNEIIATGEWNIKEAEGKKKENERNLTEAQRALKYWQDLKQEQLIATNGVSYDLAIDDRIEYWSEHVIEESEAIKECNRVIEENTKAVELATAQNQEYAEAVFGVAEAANDAAEAVATLNTIEFMKYTNPNQFAPSTNTPVNWKIGNNAHLGQQYEQITRNGGLNIFADASQNAGFAKQYEVAIDGVTTATEGATEASNGLNGVWTNVPQIGGGVINTTEIMSNEFGSFGKVVQNTTDDVNVGTYALQQFGTGVKFKEVQKGFKQYLAPNQFTDTAKGIKTEFETPVNSIKASKEVPNQIINPIKSGDYKGTGSYIQTAVQGAVNAITANGSGIYKNIKNQITGQNYGVPGASISRAVQYEVNKTTADGGKIYRNIDSAIYAQPFSKTGGQVGADLQSGIYYGFSSKTICGAIFDGMKKAMASLPFSQIGVSMGNDIKSGIAWSLQGSQLYVEMIVGNKKQQMYGRVSAASLYAMGGFPSLTQGSIFVAGENGAEAVGTINGRTGVANRDQIASAIAMALQPMLGNGGSSTTNVNVNMDSRTVARASLKGQRAMNRQFNITAQA